MKYKVWRLLTLVVIVAILTCSEWKAPAVAQNGAKPAPKAVPIPQVERQGVVDAYRAVVIADKDLQIAILKARLKCNVDESWLLDFNTMTFAPPMPPAQPSKP